MKRSAGFSIIELMIAIVLLGILLTFGLPAFGTYMHNAILRATTESFLAGLQTARGEAIRRNVPVDFVLTSDGDNHENTFDVVTPSLTGQSWVIRTSDLLTFIEGKNAAEGSNRNAATGSPVQVSGSVNAIVFNGLGVTSLPATATFQFTNPSGGLCAASGGPMRCLDVVVSPGGQSRICDPAVTAAGDTRGC